jgi:hypothetical protein
MASNQNRSQQGQGHKTNQPKGNMPQGNDPFTLLRKQIELIHRRAIEGMNQPKTSQRMKKTMTAIASEAVATLATLNQCRAEQDRGRFTLTARRFLRWLVRQVWS